MPKATFKNPTLITATCSTADKAVAAQIHRLVNRLTNALSVSDRALKHCNRCAMTSTVKPAVRAVAISPVRTSASIWSISPPGRYMSMVNKATTEMTSPISNTPAHMRKSITRELTCRGLRVMTPGVGGSMPNASAGQVSVIRLSHKICVASSGKMTAAVLPVSSALFRPITFAPTTPKNTVNTSPIFDDNR